MYNLADLAFNFSFSSTKKQSSWKFGLNVVLQQAWFNHSSCIKRNKLDPNTVTTRDVQSSWPAGTLKKFLLTSCLVLSDVSIPAEESPCALHDPALPYLELIIGFIHCCAPHTHEHTDIKCKLKDIDGDKEYVARASMHGCGSTNAQCACEYVYEL